MFKDLIEAGGGRNLGNLRDRIQFLMVDCDSNATGFPPNPFERAGARGCGMLNEVGSGIYVQYKVCLVGKEWVLSFGVRLDRLCLRTSLNFDGMQGAYSVTSLDDENMSAYSVIVVGSARQLNQDVAGTPLASDRNIVNVASSMVTTPQIKSGPCSGMRGA